ncbi:MAG: hypothetical protein K2O47_05625 [Muribaculaceae bacterium]|nr:hypothetical protein [Muribaculaceae bacterium]
MESGFTSAAVKAQLAPPEDVAVRLRVLDLLCDEDLLFDDELLFLVEEEYLFLAVEVVRAFDEEVFFCAASPDGKAKAIRSTTTIIHSPWRLPIFKLCVDSVISDFRIIS